MLGVDVIIPVHGAWELTARCLDSLAPRDASVRRVIVVDDASPDDTAARLRERGDVVAVILERNLGFAGACNAGARVADADALFFLNNDTLVPAGTIDRLAASLIANGVDATGPKLLFGDGTLQAAGLVRIAGQAHVERLLAYLDPDLPEANVPYAPIALSGAALLIRRAAFDDAGGFDEGFRNGSEDVDLCLNLWARGYRLRYEPQAAIVHLEGSSRGKATDEVHNDRRLIDRWERRLRAVPACSPTRLPVLDIRWHSDSALEEAVRRCFAEALAAHAGGPVVYGRSGVARVAAALEARPRLSIEHRGHGRPADIAWGAPHDAASAAALGRRGARRYWVPSQQGAALLREAGIPPARIAVTRPGFAPASAEPAPAGVAGLLVHGEATAEPLLARISGAFGPRAHVRIVAERAGSADVARLRAAPLVVFADAGDAWGLLGGAALSGGALTIALEGSPFLEPLPRDACVAVAHAGAIPEAVRAALADPERFAGVGPRAAREAARRFPDLQAGRRIRELSRALIHGVTDPRTFAIGAATAAALRRAPARSA